MSPSPEPSKFLWPSTRPLYGGGGITVIVGMRSPNITLLTRFMGLFIASSKTLINNVSHTNDCGRVVKSFLYWNFCSFIPSPLAFTFTMKINCKSSRLRPKLLLTSNTLYDYRQPIDQFIMVLTVLLVLRFKYSFKIHVIDYKTCWLNKLPCFQLILNRMVHVINNYFPRVSCKKLISEWNTFMYHLIL